MHTAGMICQDCHGSVANVGQTIANGRQPWLQEPSCGQSGCHGSNYATETNTLYRNSRGHSGLYCSACHGSPHAIQPTTQPNDNVQNIALQGWAGTLKKCSVCHGVTPTMPGPHGIMGTDVKLINGSVPEVSHLNAVYPNPTSSLAHIGLQVKDAGSVNIKVFSSTGKYIETIYTGHSTPGEYQIDFNITNLSSGVYSCVMTAGKACDVKNFIVVK